MGILKVQMKLSKCLICKKKSTERISRGDFIILKCYNCSHISIYPVDYYEEYKKELPGELNGKI